MFYENLESVCKKHETTVTNLANELSIPRTTIYSWKRNGCTPRPNIVSKLAQKLDVTPDELTKANKPANDPKKELMNAFKSLNPRGQKTAITRVKELSEINRYVG